MEDRVCVNASLKSWYSSAVVMFQLLTQAFETLFTTYIVFFPMARQPLGGLGLVILRSHDHTIHDHTLDTPHSVGLLWTRDQLVAETST
jgi:hypothetical protein